MSFRENRQPFHADFSRFFLILTFFLKPQVFFARRASCNFTAGTLY